MQYLLMALFSAIVVGLDQWTKYLVVENIPLHTQIPVIDGLFHLTYARNTGAAFSMLEGGRWLFIVLFIVLTVMIFWEFKHRSMPFSTFERWCIVAIYAGGLGNMIDRVRLGYVVDMIEVEFIKFPVFNVADSFITCGCIALIASLVLLNKEFWKEDKK